MTDSCAGFASDGFKVLRYNITLNSPIRPWRFTMNIIFLIIDTMRYDYIGTNGNNCLIY